jgi:hypothetical protein
MIIEERILDRWEYLEYLKIKNNPELIDLPVYLDRKKAAKENYIGLYLLDEMLFDDPTAPKHKLKLKRYYTLKERYFK